MRPFWSRFVRHAILVGVALAVIGYVLARAFLIAHRIYSGGAHNPENERVLWQTPLVMSILGILMSGCLDMLSIMFRKRAPVAVSVPNPPTPMA